MAIDRMKLEEEDYCANIGHTWSCGAGPSSCCRECPRCHCPIATRNFQRHVAQCNGEYLAEFFHPDKWANIYGVISARLGPDFPEWDGGVRFLVDGRGKNVMVIFHRDKQRSVRVLMNGIGGLEPAIAGGWFTALRKERERRVVSV